jgi:hypothetical protein
VVITDPNIGTLTFNGEPRFIRADPLKDIQYYATGELATGISICLSFRVKFAFL